VRITRLIIGTAVGTCLILPVPPAHAVTCAIDPVAATGEPSRFIWLAKTKARANWRRKVRSLPQLGAPYAVWAQADYTTERCVTGPKNTVCTFTGTPCRK
jgi:hypothetical protein